jgi:hypothetical protein
MNQNHSLLPMPRYSLRTLLILLAIGPPALAAQWWFFMQPEFRRFIFTWILIGCMDAIAIFYLLLACATMLSHVESRP